MDSSKTVLVVEEIPKKRTSTGSKILYALLFILLATTIAFAVLYFMPAEVVEPAKPNEICMRRGCVEAANLLLQNMNREVNPCDNFYEFACGNWNKTSSGTIPDDKSRWGVFDILRTQLSRDLREVLGGGAPIGNADNATLKTQKYFAQCLNETLIDEQGIEAFTKHFNDFFSQKASFWPFMSDNETEVPTTEQIKYALIFARKFQITLGFLSNGISTNSYKPEENMIAFYGPSFGLSRADLTTMNDTRAEKARDAYLTYMTELGAEFQKNIKGETEVNPNTTATYIPIFRRILDLEMDLATNTLNDTERRNISLSRNPMDFTNFTTNYQPKLLKSDFWTSYFESTWDGFTLDMSRQLNVGDLRYYIYLKNVTDTLTDANSGGLNLDTRRMVSNWIGLRFVERYASRLDKGFRDVLARFTSSRSGVTASIPRWESCANTANTEFPNPVGRLYVEKHFLKETKERMIKMTDYILKAFEEIVMKSYWMTEKTRTAALAKARLFTSHVGYDDYIVENTTRLNDEYKDFVTNSTYFLSYVNYQKFESINEKKLLEHKNSAKDWITGSAIVNAFYARDYNSISFPAGILQTPFLGADYPDYWNYGAIGVVIGHEITHGFDDQGSQANGNGILENWWDEESRANFRSRAQGIIDQYSAFEYYGIKLKGANNQGENIADNGGIKEAFAGYRAFVQKERNGTAEPRLPGFETFTPEQIFFLGHAQVWCSDYRPLDYANQVNNGAHSPGRWRVIGPIQNHPDFGRIYGCEPGSASNPVLKRSVW